MSRPKQGSPLCIQGAKQRVCLSGGLSSLPVSSRVAHAEEALPGAQGSTHLSSPLGANKPAGMAWLLGYPHARQLGNHFGSHPVDTPWQFGAGTGGDQLTATRSGGPCPGRALTAAACGTREPRQRDTAPGPSLAAESVRIQTYPGVEYQGYFLKRKLTSNVCN